MFRQRFLNLYATIETEIRNKDSLITGKHGVCRMDGRVYNDWFTLFQYTSVTQV